MSQLGELPQARFLAETDDPVIARVHRKKNARVLIQRCCVVLYAGLVSGTNLDHACAALTNDIGYTERTADLD